MEDIEEYSESLRRSFDRLQCSLAARLELGFGSDSSARLSELDSQVHELSIRNQALERELNEQRIACDEWKATCRELKEKLDASIETIKSILEQEISK